MAIAPGLVGINFAHPFEQFVSSGFFDFGRGRAFAPAAPAAGDWWMRF